MAAHATLDRPFDAFSAPFKTKLNQRREARIRYRAAFSLFWDEQSGQPKYGKGFSKEVSEHGLSLEMPQAIPVGTQLAIRSDSGELFGSALVKHVTKRASNYVVGIQLGYSLLDEALALVREVYSTSAQ
jgi:hypothetical protein